MQELWAEVEDYPNYQVSNYGFVYSRTTDRILKARPSTQGYLRVSLSNEGRRKDKYIHQLVASAFFTNFEPGTYIRHINGDLTNNSTRNLALRRLEPPDRELVLEVERKKSYYSKNRPGSKVRCIETGEIFRTVREAAHYLGGDYSSIYGVLKGKRKKHLGKTFEWYTEDGDTDGIR